MTPPQYTFDAISPLVGERSKRGRRVAVRFACPVSDLTATASYAVPATRNDNIARVAGRGLLFGLQAALGGVIYKLLGRNFLSRLLAGALMGVAFEVDAEALLISDEEEQLAVIEAFRTVQSRFLWDPRGERWIGRRAARDALNGFERTLAEHPIEHNYDRQVMARMLVEVANADGQLHDGEHGWLQDLIPADLGSVRDLGLRPPLTQAELGEVDRKAAPSLLMLAWTVALVDEQLTEPERLLSEGFAKGLGLGRRDQDKARQAAQDWVIGELLQRAFDFSTHDGHARKEVLQLAEKLGIPRADAEAAEARFQRAHAGSRQRA